VTFQPIQRREPDGDKPIEPQVPSISLRHSAYFEVTTVPKSAGLWRRFPKTYNRHCVILSAAFPSP